MNVHLQQNFLLPAAVYADNQLMIKNFNITVDMVTLSTNIDDLDIASKRIEWFMYNQLSDAVFVDQTDAERNSILAMLGLNVVTIPGPPVDQMIGMMLSCKLDAIAEGRLEVTRTLLSSDTSNGLSFVHLNTQTIGPFEEPGWWNDATTAVNNVMFDNQESNVVKVTVNPWLEVGLPWSSTDTVKTEAKIIMGNFNKKHDT
jgi:hypothetical protein